MRREWGIGEVEELKRLTRLKTPLPDIAKALKRSYWSVSGKADKLGLPTYKRVQSKSEWKPRVLPEMIEAGGVLVEQLRQATAEEIAERVYVEMRRVLKKKYPNRSNNL